MFSKEFYYFFFWKRIINFLYLKKFAKNILHEFWNIFFFFQFTTEKKFLSKETLWIGCRILFGEQGKNNLWLVMVISFFFFCGETSLVCVSPATSLVLQSAAVLVSRPDQVNYLGDTTGEYGLHHVIEQNTTLASIYIW